MNKLKKGLVIGVFSVVSLAGLTTPFDNIIAESERMYLATNSPEVRSSLFKSIDSNENISEKILNDKKKIITSNKVGTKTRVNEYIKKEADSAARVEKIRKENKKKKEAAKKTLVGEYQLTAYIATGCPCADGSYPQVGHTVACNNPQLWHKWIEIEGYGTYYVHDTGGMSSNVIDIFCSSYGEAINFGRRSANVYILDKK